MNITLAYALAVPELNIKLEWQKLAIVISALLPSWSHKLYSQVMNTYITTSRRAIKLFSRSLKYKKKITYTTSSNCLHEALACLFYRRDFCKNLLRFCGCRIEPWPSRNTVTCHISTLSQSLNLWSQCLYSLCMYQRHGYCE